MLNYLFPGKRLKHHGMERLKSHRELFEQMLDGAVYRKNKDFLDWSFENGVELHDKKIMLDITVRMSALDIAIFMEKKYNIKEAIMPHHYTTSSTMGDIAMLQWLFLIKPPSKHIIEHCIANAQASAPLKKIEIINWLKRNLHKYTSNVASSKS